jgi:hypothetical protein
MRVLSSPPKMAVSGFGMLKSKKAPVPAAFDPADLLGGETNRPRR